MSSAAADAALAEADAALAAAHANADVLAQLARLPQAAFDGLREHHYDQTAKRLEHERGFAPDKVAFFMDIVAQELSARREIHARQLFEQQHRAQQEGLPAGDRFDESDEALRLKGIYRAWCMDLPRMAQVIGRMLESKYPDDYTNLLLLEQRLLELRKDSDARRGVDGSNGSGINGGGSSGGNSDGGGGGGNLGAASASSSTSSPHGSDLPVTDSFVGWGIYSVAAVLYIFVFAGAFSPALWRWVDELGGPAGATFDMFGQFELDRARLVFSGVFALPAEVTFWLAQGLLLLVMRRPALYNKYRVRGKDHATFPSAKLLGTCMQEIAVGHGVRPLLLWLAYPLWHTWAGMQVHSGPTSFPSVATVCLHLAGSVAVDDTLFYWSHRAMHESRWWYKNVHKQHHEFKHSVGLAVEYAHFLEDLLSNTFSTLAGPLLLGSHGCVVIGYTSIKLWQSIDAHSGMVLPFPLTPWNLLPGMDCARAHDYHHSHNVGNFGGFFMFWDWLMGTDSSYRKHLLREMQEKKRP